MPTNVIYIEFKLINAAHIERRDPFDLFPPNDDPALVSMIRKAYADTACQRDAISTRPRFTHQSPSRIAEAFRKVFALGSSN